MAVTIVQQPQNYSQSGQPMVFTFSSNQTGQANFSYIVEVYINSNLVYTAKLFPTNGIYGFFDCSEVAERYVNVSPIATTLVNDALNYNTIYLIVRENYGTPPTNQANATTSTKDFYKAKSKYTFTSSLYYGNNFAEFLSNFDSKKLYVFGSQRLTFIANDETPDLKFDFRDLSGTQIKLETETSVLGNILNLYLTYSNLSTIFGSGTFTNVYYVDVYADMVAGDTEFFRIYIDHSFCATFQNEITFLNFLGGLDVYHFTRMKRYTRTTKPNQFKTNEGVLSNTGTFTTLDTSGQYNYQITQDETVTLQTGWINESDFNVLNDQLLTSPFVLLNGKRVAITDATAEEKYRKFDTLFNFSITIKQKTFTSTVL
jgi:hypothetical protein